MLIIDVTPSLVLHLDGSYLFLSNPSGGPVTLTHEQYALIGGLAEELLACRACEGHGRVPHEYGGRLPMQDCASCDGHGWKLSVNGVAILGKLMASFTRPDPEEERAARVREKYQANTCSAKGATDGRQLPEVAEHLTCGSVTSAETSP